jgi:hypothetical protein
LQIVRIKYLLVIVRFEINSFFRIEMLPGKKNKNSELLSVSLKDNSNG